MNKPFSAYVGTEPFVFVCYAHSDSDIVYSDLVELNRAGINLWYDEGIPAGKSWRAEIAAAIRGATKLLYFISDASISSANCLREIDFALSHDVEIIPVYLDESRLPGELELVLNRVHALFRQTDSLYMNHLLAALQDNTRIAALRPLTKKRNLRFGLRVLAIGFSMLAILVWTQLDTKIAPDQVDLSTIGAPNAVDRYLEGVELLERWDKTGSLDNAIRLFREATTHDPSFALAFARLADALRIRYRLTGDETWLDEATENAEEAVRLNAGLGPVQVAFGRIHLLHGNFDIAFAALERALSIDANDAEANRAMASAYSRLGRTDDAETAIQKALSLDPESLSGHNEYGNFLYDQGRFEGAIREWQTVIRIAPDHYAAFVNLGSALDSIGRSGEAIAMYQRSIEIQPSYMAYSNLGTAYSESGRYSDAVDAYREAIRFNDTDWLAWGNLAFVYSWIDEMGPQASETFDRAIQLAEAARIQMPRDPFVHSDLALYYAKTEQPELAIQRLKTAITLGPEIGEILVYAAEAYEIIGQRDNAIELIQKSLEFRVTRQQLERNLELSDLLLDPRMQALP